MTVNKMLKFQFAIDFCTKQLYLCITFGSDGTEIDISALFLLKESMKRCDSSPLKCITQSGIQLSGGKVNSSSA